MSRKRLHLQDLVAAGVFDASNWRHRKALDESEPLEHPELEELRRHALSYRDRNDADERDKALREFAAHVAKMAPW